MSRPKIKTDGLHVRISPADKKSIKDSAHRLGVTVTDYIIMLNNRHVEQRESIFNAKVAEYKNRVIK